MEYQENSIPEEFSTYSSSSISNKSFHRLDISIHVSETIESASNFFTTYKFPHLNNPKVIENYYVYFLNRFYNLWMRSAPFTKNPQLIANIEDFFSRDNLSCWYTELKKDENGDIVFQVDGYGKPIIDTKTQQKVPIKLPVNAIDSVELFNEYIVQLVKDGIYDASIERFTENPYRAWEQSI